MFISSSSPCFSNLRATLGRSAYGHGEAPPPRVMESLFPSKKKNLSFLSDSLLPCFSFPGGDDWARGGAISPVFARPFAGEERILQVCTPLLFPCAVRDRAPQTLTKLYLYSDLNPVTGFRLQELSGVHAYTHILCWIRPCSVVNVAANYGIVMY